MLGNVAKLATPQRVAGLHIRFDLHRIAPFLGNCCCSIIFDPGFELLWKPSN
jgi:hypothetical protein